MEEDKPRYSRLVIPANYEHSSTATAMSSSVAYFGDLEERSEWERLPRELGKLDTTKLRMLAELAEPLGPKLTMLLGWRPRVVSEPVLRLAATSVLHEKLEERARSHARTLQWIAALTALLGFALGWWLRGGSS